MTATPAKFVTVAALVLACACEKGGAPERRLASRAEIDPSGPVAGRVGGLIVPSSLVLDSAKARGVSPRVALVALLDDAVLAHEALARGLDARDTVRRGLDAALARQVTRRLRAAAIARGPVDDDELRKLTERHWKEVDLPARVRVVHAVVLRPKQGETPERIVRSKALAEAIRAAVASDLASDGGDAEAFEKRVKAVPGDGIEIKVERLPPFVQDGRVAERDAAEYAMNEVFAAAAFAVAAGGTSPVVETPFGWHVIRVLERLPEERVPAERRREMFAAECIANRARGAYEALLAELKRRHPPTVEPYAESELAKVQLSTPMPMPAVAGATQTPSLGAGAPERPPR